MTESVCIKELCFVYNDLPLSVKAKRTIVEQKLDRIDLDKYPGKRLLSWTKLNLNPSNEDLALEILECLFEHRRDKIYELLNQEIEFDDNDKKRGVSINNILLNSIHCKWFKIIDFFGKNDFIDFLKNDYPYHFDIFKFTCQFANEEIINKLLEYGIDKIDFNSVNDDNENALIVACRNKLENVAIKILNKIQNINHTTNKGDVALHYIASNGFNDLFDLIKNMENLDFNIENDEKSTALLFAALNQKNYIVFELLKYNINLLHQNKLGYTVLHYAIYRKNKTLINTLIDMEPRLIITLNVKKDLNPLFLACSHQLFEIIDKMLNHLDIMDEEFLNMKDSKDLTFLEYLVLQKKSDLVVKLLNSNKCKTFYETIDNIPKLNAFVYACHMKDEKVTKQILEIRNRNNQILDDYLLEKEFAFACYNKLYETTKKYILNHRLKFNYQFTDTDIDARLYDIICKNNWEDVAIEIYDRMNFEFNFFEFDKNNDTILIDICNNNMENLLIKLENHLPIHFSSNQDFNKWKKHYHESLDKLKSKSIKNKTMENIISSKLIIILKNEKERLLQEKKLRELEEEENLKKQKELLLWIEGEDLSTNTNKSKNKSKNKKEKNNSNPTPEVSNSASPKTQKKEIVPMKQNSGKSNIVVKGILKNPDRTQNNTSENIKTENDKITLVSTSNEVKTDISVPESPVHVSDIDNSMILNPKSSCYLQKDIDELLKPINIGLVESWYHTLIPLEFKFDGKYWY